MVDFDLQDSERVGPSVIFHITHFRLGLQLLAKGALAGGCAGFPAGSVLDFSNMEIF